jgi:hypothetical protein
MGDEKVGNRKRRIPEIVFGTENKANPHGKVILGSRQALYYIQR